MIPHPVTSCHTQPRTNSSQQAQKGVWTEDPSLPKALLVQSWLFVGWRKQFEGSWDPLGNEGKSMVEIIPGLPGSQGCAEDEVGSLV